MKGDLQREQDKMAARKRPSQADMHKPPPEPKPIIPCAAPGCTTPAFCSVDRVNMCRAHYEQHFEKRPKS